MQIEDCRHIRIRDNNNYGMNVERTIKHFEEIYQIDFRTLPQWEKLVQRLHLSITDCKRKIQDSKRRKATIIDKLCIESCRPSPFELTDELYRTAKKWQIMEARMKMTKKSNIILTGSEKDSSNDAIGYGEILGEESLGRHPNTEVVTSTEPSKEKEELITTEESHLPVYICSNQHKRLSLLRSDYSYLSLDESSPAIINVTCNKGPEEWLAFPKTTNIISVPNKITIENQSLDEQTISFSLTNSCDYPYLNLRYKGVTDSTQFRRAKIIPVTPVKLFPGIAVNFKFVFKLQPNPEGFVVDLFFKVGQKVLAEAPVKGFCLPLQAKFSEKPGAIEVDEEINVPSTYFWHLNANNGFPSSDVTVNVTDKHCYNLHITKINLNLIQESGVDDFSIKPMTPSSTDLVQKEQDQDVVAHSKTFLSGKFLKATDSALVLVFIELIINDAIQRALDVFVFDKIFLPLKPFSKNTIKVYQTKAEHIGFHQSVYEFKFSNPETEETVLRKTIKVFGEVLPNPVRIEPDFLDMTVSPIARGYVKNHFTIINSHKRFPVTIKIKLTTKMKQLIRINPMTAFIPTRSHVNFVVSFCSKDLNKYVIEDFVHLTIKIIVIGDKSVYNNLSPIYYEIIAPCSSEFIKVYKKEGFI